MDSTSYGVSTPNVDIAFGNADSYRSRVSFVLHAHRERRLHLALRRNQTRTGPGYRQGTDNGREAAREKSMTEIDDLGLAPFDASDYLDDEDTIAEYLRAALENPDPDAFLTAVRDVAKARGISRVATDAGLGRESLYKALRPGAKPRFDTVRRMLGALGVKLDIGAPQPRP